jgi:flagellar protein FliL
MASVPVISDTNASAPPSVAGVGFMQLLMMAVLTVLLTVAGVVGAVIYLARSGRLTAAPISEMTAKPEPAAALMTHEVVLEPLLVNLADADGHSYLRAGVTLRVEDQAKPGKSAKGPEGKDGKGAADVSAPLRDTVLDVLGRQQAAGLLVPDGKEKLKSALKSALLERDPETKVTDVYFTEFLVQR